MNKQELLYAGILLLGVFVGSCSQVLLKLEANKEHDSFIEEYMNFRVIIAYTLFIGTTLLSVLAYKRLPLSLGPVLETTSYLYISLFGYFVFREQINKHKVAALCIIVLGIIISCL